MKNRTYAQKFKFLEHTADVKFRAFGKTLEEVFENSALALKETIVGKRKIKKTKKKEIKVRGKDFESLLYNFLEEFLILLDSEGFILSKFGSIKINPKTLEIEAEVMGDSVQNYNISNPVKAVTYNEMFVKQEKGRWVCQVVLDV